MSGKTTQKGPKSTHDASSMFLHAVSMRCDTEEPALILGGGEAAGCSNRTQMLFHRPASCSLKRQARQPRHTNS